MSEANVSLFLSANPGKGCAADLKSQMTCITTARFKLNMNLDLYLFVSEEYFTFDVHRTMHCVTFL
jgi:hypothetical protein